MSTSFSDSPRWRMACERVAWGGSRTVTRSMGPTLRFAPALWRGERSGVFRRTGHPDADARSLRAGPAYMRLSIVLRTDSVLFLSSSATVLNTAAAGWLSA
ncbi:hypothetical protein GCM10023075_66390 [Streptosporangium album]